ncbi:MAG: N-acyl-D-amino-acid deacylase family protein [Planctomycetota bacterium]
MTHFTVASCLLAVLAGAVEADVVIKDVEIHDGSGAVIAHGDIAIKDDRIVAVGEVSVAGEPRRIRGEGLVAAPGFIDLHTHCDGGITKKATRLNRNYLTQGVTTVVTGNCGGGPVDVARYLKQIETAGAGTNVVHLIPHGSVRREAMGSERRSPSADELEKMKKLVEEGMRAGAWGMSTGLIYAPGSYAETSELIELSRVVAAHGGVYASHLRSEGSGLLEAVEEALTIGAAGGAPVHISHMKASGRVACERQLAATAVEMVLAARAKGQVVTADQYPYIASSTSLAAMLIPDEYGRGKKLAEALADPKQAEELRAKLKERLDARSGGEKLFVARYAKGPAWQGKSLAMIAEETGKAVVEVVLEIQQNGGADMVNFGMREEDVVMIMRQPFVSTASDGGCQVPDDTVPHPRKYGSFPRKIGRYALENGTIPLEQAIRSGSGLPADTFGIPERGYLRAAYFADIVVFDPRTFRDTATFEKPHQYATGVRYLFVNGVLAIDDGKVTEKLAGRALRHAVTTP